MKGQEKIFNPNRNKNKTRIAILLSDKTDFKTKTRTKSITYDKEPIQEENIFVSVCVYIYIHNISNIEAPKYIRQILTHLKRRIDTNARVVGGFNTWISNPERRSIRKYWV